ncbi:helix-turn-helix domain-containing protein [Salmonella enterica]|nr:helix-turn-helix domain-containing protein [Salmonella enterica]MIV18204.1 helix-turn-helix domain-containing protein [Salmonella enterica]
MTERNDTMGHRIRWRRRRLKLSQSDVADKVGVSMAAVSLWETGKTNISSDKLLALAEILECDVEWLLDGVQPQRTDIEDDKKISEKESEDERELDMELQTLIKIYETLPDHLRTHVLRVAVQAVAEYRDQLKLMTKNLDNIIQNKNK